MRSGYIPISWVISGALMGTLVGHLYPIPWDPEDPTPSGYQAIDYMIQRSHHRLAGTIIGAVLGVIADLCFHGWPRRRDWQFSIRVSLVIVLLAGILCYAVQSYWIAMNLGR
jgi:hypothetical protein